MMRATTRTTATPTRSMARFLGRKRCKTRGRTLQATATKQGLDLRDAIEKLVRREDLSLEETRDVLTVRGTRMRSSFGDDGT